MFFKKAKYSYSGLRERHHTHSVSMMLNNPGIYPIQNISYVPDIASSQGLGV